MLFSVWEQAISHTKNYVPWGVILLSLMVVGTVFDSDKKGTAVNIETDYKETAVISRYKTCKCMLRKWNCDVNSMDWRKLLCG